MKYVKLFYSIIQKTFLLIINKNFSESNVTAMLPLTEFSINFTWKYSICAYNNTVPAHRSEDSRKANIPA